MNIHISADTSEVKRELHRLNEIVLDYCMVWFYTDDLAEPESEVFGG